MYWRFAWILFLVPMVVAAQDGGRSVIAIPLDGPRALEQFQGPLCLDIFDVSGGRALAAVNPQERRLLAAAGIRSSVLFEDANDLVRQVRPMGGVGAYHTVDMVKAELAQYAQQYPQLASVQQIGQSVEGRPIMAIKLEARAQGDVTQRPKILIMGLHHAREWISTEVPMALIQHLLQHAATDSRAGALLAERTIWVVPVVNPDGLEYSQKHDTMWRKNRHKTWSGPWVNGVDPNRNYGFQWKGVGSSSLPFSEVYRGPAEFSEPEIQAIKTFSEQQHFTASISFHSYSELVLYPWGYTSKPCPEDKLFKSVAGELAAINHYAPETGSDLYLVNGEADDWAYGTQGTMAFTIELATSFIPDDHDIPGIVSPNLDAALHLIDRTGSLAREPGVMLHLAERLTGSDKAPTGPWSPGRMDEDSRERTLAWAIGELNARLAAARASGGTAALADVRLQMAHDIATGPRALRQALVPLVRDFAGQSE